MADGITRIAVEGFKSISKKQSIDIAPLTILAGANSSGKSSIMQPLLMLKQTLDATYDPGPLKIDGPNVRFTSMDQFLSRIEAEAQNKLLSLEIGIGRNDFCVTFSKTSTSAVEIVEEGFREDGRSILIRPKMSSEEIQSLVRFGGRGTFEIERYRFFLYASDQGSPPTTFPGMHWIEPFLRGIIHVHGLRGSSTRTYPIAAVGDSFPGTFDYYVASVVARWQSANAAEALALDADLGHIDLARRVVARRLNDAEIDLLVSRLRGIGADDLVSVADVGLGISHILPVLVALRAAAQGHLVYVEQPEIHLHPRAQVKLADILADAPKRGVRVVAETHSSLLLRAVQTLVAKGELAPDLVRLHWFSRDQAGITQVRSVVPDENGAFGDWPEDFGDVELQSEKDYLDAVESKLAG